jgi:hypothetical protein
VVLAIGVAGVVTGCSQPIAASGSQASLSSIDASDRSTSPATATQNTSSQAVVTSVAQAAPSTVVKKSAPPPVVVTSTPSSSSTSQVGEFFVTVKQSSIVSELEITPTYTCQGAGTLSINVSHSNGQTTIEYGPATVTLVCDPHEVQSQPLVITRRGSTADIWTFNTVTVSAVFKFEDGTSQVFNERTEASDA